MVEMSKTPAASGKSAESTTNWKRYRCWRCRGSITHCSSRLITNSPFPDPWLQDLWKSHLISNIEKAHEDDGIITAAVYFCRISLAMTKWVASMIEMVACYPQAKYILNYPRNPKSMIAFLEGDYSEESRGASTMDHVWVASDPIGKVRRLWALRKGTGYAMRGGKQLSKQNQGQEPTDHLISYHGRWEYGSE